MKKTEISILLNEKKYQTTLGVTARSIRDQVKPNHDIIIINGFPGKPDTPLKNNDRVVLIRRGEIPSSDEMQSLLVARHSPGVHERMKKSIVGIAGLGGLGSNVAISLTRMGVGTLILADFDIVEPSNLNRQQYNISHIGLPKTTALIQMLRSINPYNSLIEHCTILDRNNLVHIFKDADIVIECFDVADAKKMIIQEMAELMPDKYLIGASGIASYGGNNEIRTEKIGDRLYMVGDFSKAAGPYQGLMAPRVGIAAHCQANLAVSLLMEKS